MMLAQLTYSRSHANARGRPVGPTDGGCRVQRGVIQPPQHGKALHGLGSAPDPIERLRRGSKQVQVPE